MAAWTTTSRSTALNWDERAPAHAASPDYGFDRFVADPQHLSGVVRFDLPLLGDITGLDRHPPAVPHRHRHPLAWPGSAPG